MLKTSWNTVSWVKLFQEGMKRNKIPPTRQISKFSNRVELFELQNKIPSTVNEIPNGGNLQLSIKVTKRPVVLGYCTLRQYMK